MLFSCQLNVSSAAQRQNPNSSWEKDNITIQKTTRSARHLHVVSTFYQVQKVTYEKRIGQAAHSSSFKIEKNRIYNNFLDAIYDIEGSVTASLPSYGIHLNLTVRKGITNGRFGILEGSEVASDGQQYNGGFKAVSQEISESKTSEIGLRFGFEDWSDGDYNDGRLTIDLLEINPEIELSVMTGTKKQEEEKYAYNSADPGVLKIKATLKNKDGSSLDKIKNNIRWSFSGVGSSIQSWDKTWEGDSSSGKGTVVHLTLTELPKNNSDFGEKTITAHIIDKNESGAENGEIGYQSKTIKVFYNATAANASSRSGSDPNWFTYWSKVVTVDSNKLYTGVIFDSSSDDYGGTTPWANGIIQIGNPAFGTNDETGNTGIHAFYETMVHENEHLVIWEDMWGAGTVGSYDQSRDQEIITNINITNGVITTNRIGDLYPDDWEDSNTGRGFSRNQNDHYSGIGEFSVYRDGVSAGYYYEENRCRNKERNIANVKKYDDQDWSKDGKQW